MCGETEGWAASAETVAGGGTQAWSRIAACKMCQGRGMWDPQLPQTHPVTPTALIMMSLIPLSSTFGLDDPILVFPCTSSCFSLFAHSEGITVLGTWDFHWFCGYVAAGSKLFSLWQRVPAAPWAVTLQGDKESPSSCCVPTSGKSVLWHPCCCV